MRSGACTLSLLAVPLNCRILRSLATGSKRLVELRREAGSPAQSTLRSHLKGLERIGAVERRRHKTFPGAHELTLTVPGTELLSVVRTLEGWLGRAPGDPLELGEEAAKAAVRALVEGWSSTMVRALATGPHSLTELDRLISAHNYPSLERRLAALRSAGQVEARASNGRGTPYALTAWAREGIGPLAAAALWERRHTPRSTLPIGPVDAEALFLLTAPLLRLPEEVSGSCRLAVELSGDNGRCLAGATIAVEEGRIETCTSRLQGTPDAWALGSAIGWLEAMVHADIDSLEPGGDGRLARALLDSLHGTLFGAESEARHPDRLEHARVQEPRQGAGVEAVGLHPGVGDRPHLGRVGDHDASDVGREDPGDFKRRPGGLQRHLVGGAEALGEQLELFAVGGDATRRPGLAEGPRPGQPKLGPGTDRLPGVVSCR